MPSKEIDINQIEKYIDHQLDASEKLAFEKELQQNPELAQALQDYRKIFEGLKLNQNSNFKDNLQAWSQEWQELDTENFQLIHWYLEGVLSPNVKQQVESKMESDTGFKDKVSAYQKIFEGFQTERDQTFRKKLASFARAYEQQHKKPARIISLPARWTIAAAVVILLLGIGLNWMAESRFSNEAFFSDSYQPWLKENVMGKEAIPMDTFAILLENAHQFMEEKQFAAAEAAFQNIIPQIENAQLDAFNKNYFLENAQWNLLLARLAQNKIDNVFMGQLQVIADNPEHSYHQKAQALQRNLSSLMRWMVE